MKCFSPRFPKLINGFHKFLSTEIWEKNMRFLNPYVRFGLACAEVRCSDVGREYGHL